MIVSFLMLVYKVYNKWSDYSCVVTHGQVWYVCAQSVCEQTTPSSLLSAHVAVLLVVCMRVTVGSEAGPLTGRGLHTGDTHTQSHANGFHMSAFSLVCVCLSLSHPCESRGWRRGIQRATTGREEQAAVA